MVLKRTIVLVIGMVVVIAVAFAVGNEDMNHLGEKKSGIRLMVEVSQISKEMKVEMTERVGESRW